MKIQNVYLVISLVLGANQEAATRSEFYICPFISDTEKYFIFSSFLLNIGSNEKFKKFKICLNKNN